MAGGGGVQHHRAARPLHPARRREGGFGLTAVQVKDPSRLDVLAVELGGAQGPRQEALPEREHPLARRRVDVDDDHVVLRSLPRHEAAGVHTATLERSPAVLAEFVVTHRVDEAGAQPERRGDETRRAGGPAVGEGEVQQTARVVPVRHAVDPQHDIDDREAEADDLQGALQTLLPCKPA